MISQKDLIAKRPGAGISPEYQEIVIGRSVRRDCEEDTILTWDLI